MTGLAPPSLQPRYFSWLSYSLTYQSMSATNPHLQETFPEPSMPKWEPSCVPGSHYQSFSSHGSHRPSPSTPGPQFAFIALTWSSSSSSSVS